MEFERKEVIGDATLYLGDALDVMPLLDPVDFIFTDPPYGHNNNNNGDLIHRWEAALGKGPVQDSRPIAFDGVEANELVRQAFGMFNQLLRSGGCCCCCGGGGGPDPQFARWALWLDDAIGFKQMIVWDKGPMGMGWHYRRSYETVLVGEKKGAACRWFDTTDRVENVIRPGAYGIRKVIPQADDHPTPKPIELAAHFIRLHSEPGDIVLDPFMGGGSTAEAAVTLNRRFIGVDIDAEHFESTCARLRKLHKQADLFIQCPKPIQEAMEL